MTSNNINIGYKLFRLRKDDTLGPLFINRRQKLQCGVEYAAEDHKTKGFAHRPGWHILDQKAAPHLSLKGRVWAKVEFKHYRSETRPEAQGGLWHLANTMKIIEIYNER